MTALPRHREFITLGLTPGCPAGVGPELLPIAITQLVDDGALPHSLRWRFFASAALLVRACHRAKMQAVPYFV